MTSDNVDSLYKLYQRGLLTVDVLGKSLLVGTLNLTEQENIQRILAEDKAAREGAGTCHVCGTPHLPKP